jgi:uncharacterized protein (DUF427 family)
MALTIGRGPFGRSAAGRFDFTPPEHVVYVEPFPRRVRGVRAGATVVDCDRVVLVHETGRLPRYAFPAEDVRHDAAVPEAATPGHVTLAWDAVDAWFEEDEEVFVHVRDPYHRIDVVPTGRRVVVSVGGVVLADSTAVRGLYETGLPVRWYLPPDDVRMELLRPSATVTHCPYKGRPVYWTLRDGEPDRDVAWSYRGELRPEAEDIRDRVAFYDERVDVDVDGLRQERPATPWSR